MYKQLFFILAFFGMFHLHQLKAQEVSTFKAYNSVRFEYAIHLPEGYEKGDTYELVMLFSEIEPKNNRWETAIGELKSHHHTKTIYVVPKVPLGRPHWKSHPIHHGLNDLMDKVREEYGKANQQFHFIGYKEGGDVAQTYAKMSREYVESLTYLQAEHWSWTKQPYFNQNLDGGIPVRVLDHREAAGIPIDVSKARFYKVSGFVNGLKQLEQLLAQ